MKTADTFPSGVVQKLSAEFLTGAYTRLWADWGESGVTPGYNKLYYLRKGRFTFHVDGKEYIGEPGQLFLLPCHSLQTYSADTDSPAEKYWIHCTFPCGEKDLLELITLPVWVEAKDPAYVEKLFQSILAKEHPGDLDALLQQKACLLSLLAYFVEQVRTPTPLPPRETRIFAVTRYIEEHLAEELTVDRLARVVHFHPHYFIRYFRKITGCSPAEYVANVRIRRAQQLLQENTVPIKTIAQQTGLGTASYFSRTFKAHTGYSPTQYRVTASTFPEEDHHESNT